MAEQLLTDLKALTRYQTLSREQLERLAKITSKLRQIDLFEPLSDADLAIIAEKGRVIRYECGDLIIRKGDTTKTFYVIVRGQVRVWEKGESGVARLLNIHSQGDFFGEMALLDDAPRAANVDVVDDVELVTFDVDGFDRIIQHSRSAIICAPGDRNAFSRATSILRANTGTRSRSPWPTRAGLLCCT